VVGKTIAFKSTGHWVDSYVPLFLFFSLLFFCFIFPTFFPLRVFHMLLYFYFSLYFIFSLFSSCVFFLWPPTQSTAYIRSDVHRGKGGTKSICSEK
jgi:hypothetical protein